MYFYKRRKSKTMPQNTCFIRRADPNGWVQGLPHHRLALCHFLQMNPSQQEILRISVPHTQGGQFVAHFRRIDDTLCEYMDEYGRKVDIMMTTPEHAAFINRIIDHY